MQLNELSVCTLCHLHTLILTLHTTHIASYATYIPYIQLYSPAESKNKMADEHCDDILVIFINMLVHKNFITNVGLYC